MVDEQGKPVTDLARDEVTVLEDGQPRSVEFFESLGSPLPVELAGSNALLPGTFSNRPEHAPAAPRNLIALVLDLVNASAQEQASLHARLLAQLRTLPSDAHIGLYVIGNTAVAVHDFTKDVDTLRARLEKRQIDIPARTFESMTDLSGLLAGARVEQRESLGALADSTARAAENRATQVLRERRQRTLAGLRSVADHMAGVPGRKVVLWISQGFPLLTRLDGSFAEEVSATGRHLAIEDVALYPIEAEGVTTPSLYGGGLGLDDQSTKGQRFPTNSYSTTFGNLAGAQSATRVEGTAELLADITGGAVSRNSNDLTGPLRAVMDDVRGAYSVGFYPADATNERWHTITIRVSRPGVRVRHRAGYRTVVSETSNAPANQATWTEIAHRPLGSTALPIEATASITAGSLAATVHLRPEDLRLRPVADQFVADVEIAVIERGAEGPVNVRVQAASVIVPARTAGLASVPLSSLFRLGADTVSVRLVVREIATGRYGTIDIPLESLVRK